MGVCDEQLRKHLLFFPIIFRLSIGWNIELKTLQRPAAKKSKKIILLKAKVSFPAIAMENLCLKTHSQSRSSKSGPAMCQRFSIRLQTEG